MNKIAIIAPAGMLLSKNVEVVQREEKTTPYGTPSSYISHALCQGREILLLARKGYDDSIPPHKVNYRANIWALREAGATLVLGLMPAEGIRSDMIPGQLVIADQLIDYTYGREHSIFSDDFSTDKYHAFAYPFDKQLRKDIIAAANHTDVEHSDSATFGVMQGPRLATLAEVNRMERDGCDLLCMTAMPEAYLAQELSLPYATIAVITNKAAGRVDGNAASPEQFGEVMSEVVQHLNGVVEHIIKATS